MKDTPKPPTSARNKLMDFLARRDHSERELRTKLSRHFAMAEIDEAIAFAKESKWLGDPQELAERVAQQLHQRHKGHLYILNYLREKGLPKVEKDPELEMRKATTVIATRFADREALSFSEKQKVARLLNNRGFDEETIRRMIYEKF
jgi:regulatory protein